MLTGNLKVTATVGSTAGTGSLQAGRFLEIAVGLPARQRELAAEMPGRLGAFHSLPEQTVRGVEQPRFLGLGGPRHAAQTYYFLRRRTSTGRFRQPVITRSN